MGRGSSFPVFDSWVPQEYAQHFVEDGLSHIHSKNPHSLEQLEREILYAHKQHLENYHDLVGYECGDENIQMIHGMLHDFSDDRIGRKAIQKIISSPGFSLVSLIDGK